uniref:C-type lectin domain-containing protein n=1 Tax=Gadus morhua TaxID=8049 RepID=A0A8C5BPI4_GADMO
MHGRRLGQLELHQRLKNVTEQHKTVSMEVEQLLQRLKNECPIDWNKFGCKCYFSVWGSWNKSRELCVSLGADLLVVDSKEEMDFISGYDGDPWLGATDEASEGSWRWVDGTVLSADNPPWRRGKPSGGKKKNCLRKELYIDAVLVTLFFQCFHSCSRCWRLRLGGKES